MMRRERASRRPRVIQVGYNANSSARSARFLGAGTAALGGMYCYIRNSHPRFLPPLGPNQRVGAVQARCGDVGAQIFYPADIDAPRRKNGDAPYLRPGVVDGLCDWLKKYPRQMFFLLDEARHPCEVGAPVAQQEGGKRKLPLVVFSHGLGGTCELYSQWCLDLVRGSQTAATGVICIRLVTLCLANPPGLLRLYCVSPRA